MSSQDTTARRKDAKARGKATIARRAYSSHDLTHCAFVRALPLGYTYGGGSSWGNQNYITTVMAPFPFGQMLRSEGFTDRAAKASALRLARLHAEGVLLARAQCQALGLHPDEIGPYPFGPINAGAMTHVGGGVIAPGALEARPYVVWLTPHAISSLVANRWRLM